MYRILAALDEVEQTNAQVDAIENLLEVTDDVTVYLLHVFTDNPSGASIHQIESVRRAEERLRELGVDTEPVETSGDPVTKILDHADELDVEQICLGGRKRTPTGKVLFGSVTQDVIRGTDRPVLVCGGRVEKVPDEEQ